MAQSLSSAPRGTSLPPSSSAIPPQVNAIGNDLAGEVANLTVSEATQQDFSFSLPDELLLRIFSLLPVGDPSSFTSLVAIQRVSKRFMKVASDPSLWRQHLDHDFNPLNSFPDLFGQSAPDFGEQTFQHYFSLRRMEWWAEQALRKLVLAASNRTALLDNTAFQASSGLGCRRALDRLSIVERDQDPGHWLSTRYWARVTAGAVSREVALREWAQGSQVSLFTGIRRGWEALALARFSDYTGGHSMTVIEQFNALSLTDLQDYSPIDHMTSRALLQHIWNAFQSAGFDRRALTVESFFLDQILSAPASPLALHGTEFPSPSSVILFVEYLRKSAAVQDVAIITSDHFLLAVTYDNFEILFLEFSTGEIWSREEAVEHLPRFGLDLASWDSYWIPATARTTVATLVRWTGHLIERVLRAKYPFRPCEALERTATAFERGAWIAVHHLRLATLISEGGDLDTIFANNRIPTHSIFERLAVARIFSNLALFSCPGEAVKPPRVKFTSSYTEDSEDKRFPHYIPGCCAACDDPPQDLASFQSGGKTDWFHAGYSFHYTPYVSEPAEVFVVVAFESSIDDFPENYEASYLCLRLCSDRRGRFFTDFVPHSSIQHSSPASVATLLQSELEVGQFFRTFEDGLLVPNAWLERMLNELDASESAVERWHSRRQALEDYGEYWAEHQYDDLEREGDAEELEYEWKDAVDKKGKRKSDRKLKGKRSGAQSYPGRKENPSCVCGQGRGGKSSRGRAKAAKQTRNGKTWN